MGINEKRSYLLLCLFVLFSIQEARSQNSDVAPGKNSFFIEYIYEGLDYAIKYDRIFAHGRTLKYSAGLGFSYLKNQVALPVEFNIFSGKNSHHPEFTLSVIPVFKKHENSGTVDKDKLIYLFCGPGYRFQKLEKGPFCRVHAGPLVILDPTEGDFWNMDPKVKFSFSLSAGVSF